MGSTGAKKMRPQLGSEREEFEQSTQGETNDTNEPCLSCAGRSRPDALPCACQHIASKGRSLRTWSRYRWRLLEDPMWGSPPSSIACSLVGAPVVSARQWQHNAFIWFTHTCMQSTRLLHGFSLGFLWLFFVCCALLGPLKRHRWDLHIFVES